MDVSLLDGQVQDSLAAFDFLETEEELCEQNIMKLQRPEMPLKEKKRNFSEQ